ncbi:MAG TPA: ATP-binding protein [Frankiaceae bacterium]|nr:ATP-binding protein [Frankiaceae bacterium]
MPDRPVTPVLAVDGEKRVELSLRVLDAAPIGMVVTSSSGRIVWANASFGALVGATRGVEGRTLGDLVTVERTDEAAAGMAAVVAGEQAAYECEERWHVPGNEVRSVVVSAALSPDPDGGAPYVVLQTLDTTDRRRAELELRRSNDELTQFAYVASHDLSEPLRVIAGHVQLLAGRYGDALDDDAKTWIEFAVDGCARMRSLIDDLLAYSRAGRDLKIVDVDLGAVAATVAAEYPGVVRTEPLPSVRADRMLVHQVLRNLLSNATKFARADVPAEVALSAERIGTDWLVTVADNGIGIDPRHRERVFNVFQRLHGRGDYEGTGIGLAIVRKGVEQMGGRVWVDDSPLGGTAIRFTLPAPEGALA